MMIREREREIEREDSLGDSSQLYNLHKRIDYFLLLFLSFFSSKKESQNEDQGVKIINK